jgi:hypothetical protein
MAGPIFLASVGWAMPFPGVLQPPPLSRGTGGRQAPFVVAPYLQISVLAPGSLRPLFPFLFQIMAAEMPLPSPLPIAVNAPVEVLTV